MAISDLKLPEGVHAHTFKNPASMAEGLASSVAGQLNQAIAEQGVATLVVSGGRSPVVRQLNQVPQAMPFQAVCGTQVSISAASSSRLNGLAR